MMDRRDFLAASAGMAGLAALGGCDKARSAESRTESAPPVADIPTDQISQTRRGDMLYRKLGRTGEEVSIVGLGGAHLAKAGSDDEAIRLVRSAIERGITFMDNSWDYSDGMSEERMGRALADGGRKNVFLMTKFDSRSKDGALKQLDESLKRLKVERVDLWQVHEIIRMDDGDRVFAQGGAVEAIQQAQQAGKVRYCGFTGHKDPAIFLRMLEVAKAHHFTFDTVQMPLSVMDAHFRSFEMKVLPELLRQRCAVLGMKCMADRHILESKTVSATECLHYAMTLPVSTVITGIENMRDLDQALDAVKNFKPLDHAQTAKLMAQTAAAAQSGKFEPFKTTDGYDSTAHHPEWLR